VAFGFTTSGRSENVRRGLAAARDRGAVTVALTGAAGLVGGGADHVLAVPSDATAHVQEVHLMLLHVWCIHIDEALGEVQPATGEVQSATTEGGGTDARRTVAAPPGAPTR
jgi:D-sedoheptulose 7-phosphate isomerase